MSGKPKKKVVKAKEGARTKKPFDYKTTIWVGLALVALVLVVMAILKFSQNEKIDSSYFHDEEGKIVITMDKENAALDNTEWEAPVTHVVYYYDGNKVTSGRAFYEYPTEAEAEEAYKHLGTEGFADNKKVSGRFVVFDLNKARYENLTVDEVRSSIEILKEIDAIVLDYDENYVKAQ